MTSIINTKLTYLSLAIITALVMAFVVLPQLPQVKSTLSIGTTADQASAWGSSCGNCGNSGGTNDPKDNNNGQSNPQQTTANCTIKLNKTTVNPGDSVSGNVYPSKPTNNGTVHEHYINGKKIGSWSGGGDNYRKYGAGVAGSYLTKPGTYTYTINFSRTGYNNYSCSAKITVKEVPKPAAKCDGFSASPTSLPYGGGDVKLTWNTTNATKVSINNGVGTVAADDSKTVHVTGTKTFTLTATGTGGNDSCTTKVTVKPATVAKCDGFSASPTSLPYGGGDVKLTWNTTNATKVSINNGVGTVAADGSKNINVSDTTTFTLTAEGTNGNDSCTATVTVGAATAPVCEYLKASDTSVTKGEMITLSWDTTNASSASLNNGIGSVALSGSKNVVINNDINYVLTVNNNGKQDSCSVSINVEDEPEETPRCDFLQVDDDEVEEGDQVKLTWETTNADNVRINEGIGSVSKDGSINVRVYDDVTFILTAETGDKEDTCRVDVDIEDEEDEEPRPRCELDISDSKVKRGEEVTLSWETDDADDIEIEDDEGNTIFDTDDYSSSKRKKYYDGEIDVVIYEDTEFTLTARGDGGKRECDVDVEVEDNDITVYEKRDQDLVIALTQVPYTGFEAGPFLTYLFYGVLTLWALFIAYILVVRKGSVLGFSLSGANGADKVASDTEERKKVEALVAKYAGRNW